MVESIASRWEPEDDDEYESASAELKERFATWVANEGLPVGLDAPEGLLHYKWGYVDGHLTRWRRRDLDEVLLELYPAKVMTDSDELGEVLAEARAFLTFLAASGLLDGESEPAGVLVDHLAAIDGQFRSNMADQSRFSVGKRLWTDAAAEGVRLDDPAAVEAFMARLNARPRAERDAILGGGLKSGNRPQTPGRFTPPGTPPPRRSSPKRRKRRG